MNLANIKMDDSMAVSNIALWGCNGLKVLIDALYVKAEDIGNAPDNKSIVDDIYAIASMLEAHTGVIKSKLQELDEQYIKALQQKSTEVIS